LGNDSDTAINRLLRLHDTFLRICFAIKSNHLKLSTERSSCGVELIGDVAEMFESVFANARSTARQRINVGDLYRLLGERCSARKRQANGRPDCFCKGFDQAHHVSSDVTNDVNVVMSV